MYCSVTAVGRVLRTKLLETLLQVTAAKTSLSICQCGTVSLWAGRCVSQRHSAVEWEALSGAPAGGPF